MNGKRVKWIRKELLLNKNPKFMRKLMDFVDDKKLKEMNVRQIFRLTKKLWNQKLVVKEDIL